MLTFKDKLKNIKKSHLLIVGVVLLVLLFISLLWFNHSILIVLLYSFYVKTYSQRRNRCQT